MRIALLGDADRRDGPLRDLLKGGRHRVDWIALSESGTCDFRGCDLVVFDATIDDAAAQGRLVAAAHEIRIRAAGTPVLVVSAFENNPRHASLEPRPHRECQLTACGDGVWRVRCRLHELAWAETEALIREALERDAAEPVEFEYRG